MTQNEERRARMWRAMRSEKGAFEVLTVMRLARAKRVTVYRYLQYCEKAGCIARAGKRGPAFLFRLTPLGREMRETP